MSDITLAVGDGARRMTYAELAAVRGTSQASAERLVRRRGWPRQVGNDGVVRVLVPLTEARNISKPEASGAAPATAVLAPDKSGLAPVRSEVPPPAGPGQSPGQVAPDDRGHVRGLEGAIEALRDQLGVANDLLICERRRVDELQALLREERRQAQTSAPDTRSVIKEVIREIAGAAPPDDGDDDRKALQTSESAIGALREQVEYAQSGLIAERQRANELQVALTEERRRVEVERQLVEDGRKRIDELQQRVDELHIALADAVTAERIAAGEASALRAIVTGLWARPWWRRWFR